MEIIGLVIILWVPTTLISWFLYAMLYELRKLNAEVRKALIVPPDWKNAENARIMGRAGPARSAPQNVSVRMTSGELSEHLEKKAIERAKEERRRLEAENA